MTHILAAVLLAAGLFPTQDQRELYDVLSYELDFVVVPATETLEGRSTMVSRALGDLQMVQLDMQAPLEALGVWTGERELTFEHRDDGLFVTWPETIAEGETFALTVRYRGQPQAQNSFDGFHWARTESGAPWVNTSCQGTGSHAWWPGKASYFHPEDKPERISVNITVPDDLYAVSNGRLISTDRDWPAWLPPADGDWKTFKWQHDYPLETYTVTLNVAPYVVVEDELDVTGIKKPVPFIYYVLPESVEKAKVQFAQVPRLVEVFGQAFGPFPFPDSKIGFVETNFWGMEHSTAIAYGSSYPAWCEQEGETDRYARRNGDFDYILVHEFAHEWWGNAVSADHWGHFWIHEGFGTYAEGVWLEFTEGREKADSFFARSMARVPSRGSLYRGDHPESGDAYAGLIYSKGACVLHHARHCLDDDDLWWKTLREFNAAGRYGNASTEDFRALLEENSGRSWERFFDEWFYAEGAPALQGEVKIAGREIQIHITVEGEFHVPLDVAWTERGKSKVARVELAPGENELALTCRARPKDLSILHLDRIPGRHEVRVP
jgi:aminopeptidase N